jgi:multiple sugar transport system substrate-binding protein
MRRLTVSIAILLALGAAAACSSEDEENSITFWTPFATPDRMALQEETAARFTEETGIEVEVVGLEVTDMNQAMVSGAASGEVPDVVLHATDQAIAWNGQDLLDVEAANEVIDELGRDTFNQEAMDIVSVDGQPVTIPSDAWGQTLFYRTDLFEQAGIDPPQTLDDVLAAAEELNSGDTAGIVLGTKPGEQFTMQTLEWIMLANGCELTAEDDPSELLLESPECVEALGYYQDLAEASVEGDQDTESTRAAYLAGRAAMISWSPHLLDEIAGLDRNFPPTCSQCEQDPAYIAENTGILPVPTGPGTQEPQQFGQTLNLAILRNAETDAAKQFASYLLSDGYEESLGLGAEGRFPLRSGPSAGSTEYIEAWPTIPIGPDPNNQRSLLEIYGRGFVAPIEQGATQLSRWGYGHGSPELEAALFAQGTLTRELEPLFNGEDPAEVAAQMSASAAEVAEDLEE